MGYWRTIKLPGGDKLGAVAKLAADIALAVADRLNYEAGRAGKLAPTPVVNKTGHSKATWLQVK